MAASTFGHIPLNASPIPRTERLAWNGMRARACSGMGAMTAASLVGSAMALWLLVDAQRRVAGNLALGAFSATSDSVCGIQQNPWEQEESLPQGARCTSAS